MIIRISPSRYELSNAMSRVARLRHTILGFCFRVVQAAHHCVGFNAIDEDGDRCHSLGFHCPDEPCQIRLSSDHMLAVQQDGNYRATLACSQRAMFPVPGHVLLWGLEVASVLRMKTPCHKPL